MPHFSRFIQSIHFGWGQNRDPRSRFRDGNLKHDYLSDNQNRVQIKMNHHMIWILILLKFSNILSCKALFLNNKTKECIAFHFALNTSCLIQTSYPENQSHSLRIAELEKDFEFPACLRR